MRDGTSRRHGRRRAPAAETRRVLGVRTPVLVATALAVAVTLAATLATVRTDDGGYATVLAEESSQPAVTAATTATDASTRSAGGTAPGPGTARVGRATARTATAAGTDSRTASGRSSSGSSGEPAAVSTPRLRPGGALFATSCAVSATLVPSCGAYWGIYSRRYGGGDVETTVKTWESKLGRRFDIVLMYYDFSGRNGPGWFPDTPMKNLGTQRILLLDWESRNFSTGASYRWADIAAGTFDASVVVPAAKRVRAYGDKVMLGLDHEMDLSYAKHGTAAEYKAAYRHIRSVFAAQGVDNVVWTWVTSGYVAYGNGPKVKSFYPGDGYVDWIGYDPYNFFTCHDSGWETFDQTVKGFYDWSAVNGLGDKPLLLQEYGMKYGSETQSRQWYRDIDDVLRKRTRIKALVRWDSDTSCTLRIDNGPGMVEEYAAAGLAVPRP